jgi:hypothetical protein
MNGALMPGSGARGYNVPKIQPEPRKKEIAPMPATIREVLLVLTSLTALAIVLSLSVAAEAKDLKADDAAGDQPRQILVEAKDGNAQAIPSAPKTETAQSEEAPAAVPAESPSPAPTPTAEAAPAPEPAQAEDGDALLKAYIALYALHRAHAYHRADYGYGRAYEHCD